METVWSLFQHINGEEIEIEVIVGPEVITDKEQQTITVHMIQIKEIDLWNGPGEGFQDADEEDNTCFSLVHYNGTDWETLGFEMNTPKERTALIMDIIDKLQPLGVYPAQGLSRQIVLDSMGLEESLEIPFDYDDIPMRVSQIVKEEHHLEISKQLEEQKEQNEKLSEDLDQQREEMKKMQDQQAVMAKAKQQLEEKLTEETERNKALEREMKDVQQQLHEKEAVAQKEDQDSKQKSSTEMEKNEALQAKMDLYQKEMDQEIARLRSDLDDSRRELSDRQMEMEKAQEDLIMKHKESIEMKQKAISEIEEKNKKLEALVAAKAAAMEKLESDLLGMEKMNSQLPEDNARKQEAIESQLAMMAETKEEVTESLKHQTAEFMQMKLELNASRQELVDKNTDIERLQTVQDEMRADLEKLYRNEPLSAEMEKNEALQAKMDLHQKETDGAIQRLKSEVDDSRRELSDRQMEMEKEQEDLIMKHKESIEMKEAAISEIEEKNKKLEALVAAKAAAIKKLQSDLWGREKMNSQLAKDNAPKQEALESQLAMMGETEHEITESLKHQTTKFKQMKLELDASRQELADKNTDIEWLQTVQDEMKADLKKLNKTNRNLQNKLEAEKELVAKQGELLQQLADTKNNRTERKKSGSSHSTSQSTSEKESKSKHKTRKSKTRRNRKKSGSEEKGISKKMERKSKGHKGKRKKKKVQESSSEEEEESESESESESENESGDEGDSESEEETAKKRKRRSKGKSKEKNSRNRALRRFVR